MELTAPMLGIINAVAFIVWAAALVYLENASRKR